MTHRRRKPKSSRSILSKLKLMEKLEYGQDYTEIFLLLWVVMLVLSLLGAFILLPLFFFYWAALQLYSGIAFNVGGWNWKQDRKLIAKYTKESEPSLFYLSVGMCFVMGVFLSVPMAIMFLSMRR
jgi:O-antigen/teichoic acid export membrane protein